MANSKITDLTVLSSVADNDVIEIVDVSDTTQSAQGTSKQITRANFLVSATITNPVITGATINSPRIVSAILDSNGNNLFTLTATASAVNFLTYSNQAAGSYPSFASGGSDTNIGIDLAPKGNGPVRIFVTTGNTPILQAAGADTNLNLNLKSKGSGVVQANGVTIVDLSTAQTLTNKTLTSPIIGTAIFDTNGNKILSFTPAATAVNRVLITNAATGNYPSFTADGSDTNIGFDIAPKGTAPVRIYTTTGNTPTLQAAGADSNLDLKLLAKGTGGIYFASPISASSDPSYTEYGISRQAMINGNFDLWQRQTTFANPATTGILADRWKVEFVNSGTLPTTITHSRQITTPGDVPNSYYFYRITPNGAGSGFGNTDYYALSQFIEYGPRLLAALGNTVTVSFYARTSILNKKLGVSMDQNYGTGGSPTADAPVSGSAITLSSIWTKYSQTFTLPTLVGKTFGTDNNDYLKLSFWEMWGSTVGGAYGLGSAQTFVGAGSIDITQVQVCLGGVALPFNPRSIGDELQLASRYYEKSYNYTVIPGTNDAVGTLAVIAGSTTITTGIAWKVKKRVSPSVSLYSQAGTLAKVSTVGGADVGTIVSADTPSENGFLNLTDTGAGFTKGNFYYFHYEANAEI